MEVYYNIRWNNITKSIFLSRQVRILSKSTLYSCLNANKLFAQNMYKYCSLSECNGKQPCNHFSSQAIYTLLKESPLNWNSLRLSRARVNICQFPYQSWNSKSIRLQILCIYWLPWQITPLPILISSFSKFGLIKESHQNPNFERSRKNLSFIPHVIFQTTSQLKVILDKSVNNVLGEGGLLLER